MKFNGFKKCNVDYIDLPFDKKDQVVPFVKSQFPNHKVIEYKVLPKYINAFKSIVQSETLPIHSLFLANEFQTTMSSVVMKDRKDIIVVVINEWY